MACAEQSDNGDDDPIGRTPLRLAFLNKFSGQHHGQRRSYMVRLAILSSAFNKVAGMTLQIVAIPLVYRTLGSHSYELFLLLTGALATISLTGMGAGPGLTQKLAHSHASEDHPREASYFSAALRLTLLAALVGGALAMVAIRVIPPQHLFGAPFAADRARILSLGTVCVLVLMAQMLSGVVDSALAGYQEQVLSNLGTLCSTLLSLFLLLAVCRYAPNITRVIVVLYGVPVLAGAANLAVLIRRRPYLAQKLLSRCKGFYRSLLHVGLAFWAIQLASVLEMQAGVYMLAHLTSTRETNLFAIAYKVLTLSGAAVIMLTQPLWPAFTDAIARKDVAWIERSYGRIRRALTIYSCAVGLGVAVAGRWILQRFMHVDAGHNRILFITLGVYFVANVWTHLLYVSMMGMDVIRTVAVIAVLENVLVLGFGLLLVPRLGASGMALAYLAASLALPAWLLPRLMKSAIARVTARTGLSVPASAADAV